MPSGLIKLGGSETFWCCAFWVGSWTLLNHLGVYLPLELALTACGVHGLKEGAGKIGAGLASRSPE